MVRTLGAFVLLVGMATILLGACAPSPAAPTPTTAIEKIPTPPPFPTPVTGTPATTAPTATAAPQIQTGGTLRIGVRCLPSAFTVLNRVLCILPGFVVYDSLLSFDEKGAVYPELAEKWDVASDGMSVTFKLRSGVKFHDGTDFNAAAAKFNLETLIANKGSLYADVVDIDSIDTPDNLTVKVNFKTPSAASFLGAMSEQAGFQYSPTAYQKYGKDEAERNPVGAGPFALEEWVQDDHVTLKRFDQYWDKGKPYLDKIIFQLMPDPIVRTVNLKTGNVDHITEVDPKDMEGLKASKDFTVYQMPSVGWWWLPEFQNKKPPFDNRALREAVIYALDVKAIVKAIFYGHTEVANGSPFGPLSWAYDPNFKGFSYDPAKAKAKLAEGGKPDGFEFTLTAYNTGDYLPVVEAFQAQLAKVGIKVVTNLAAPAATTPKINARDYQAYIGQYTGKMDAHSAFVGFHSTSGYNHMLYSNPKVDELFDKARQTFDQKERKRYYDEGMALVIADAPGYIGFYAPVLAASTSKVQNYKLMPGWYFQFETFKNVWLKR